MRVRRVMNRTALSTAGLPMLAACALICMAGIGQ